MALHVLHRLIVPRHPPCALKSNKSNTKTHTKHTPQQTRHASGEQQNHKKLDTRVHYTVLKQHEHHPHNQPPRPVTQEASHQEQQHMPFQTPNNATNQTITRLEHNNTHQQPTGHWRTRKQTPMTGFLMPTIHPQKIINKNSLERR